MLHCANLNVWILSVDFRWRDFDRLDKLNGFISFKQITIVFKNNNALRVIDIAFNHTLLVLDLGKFVCIVLCD